MIFVYRLIGIIYAIPRIGLTVVWPDRPAHPPFADPHLPVEQNPP